jgi:hypothetical protein
MLQCRGIVAAGRVAEQAAFDRVTAGADTTKKLLESTLAKTNWFNAA